MKRRIPAIFVLLAAAQPFAVSAATARQLARMISGVWMRCKWLCRDRLLLRLLLRFDSIYLPEQLRIIYD